MKSIKKNFKANSLFYFSLGLITLGIILIDGASIFMISTLKNNLIYTILRNPFDWFYKTIIIGNFLVISGLFLLIHVHFKKEKEIFYEM